MNSFIELCQSTLLDSERNKYKNPNEMHTGDIFYISQNEPLASGELVRNPFDIGPSLLDIPDIQHPGILEPDVLLVKVEEIHDEHIATCRVEVVIDDAEKMQKQVETPGKDLSDDNYAIPDHQNPITEDGIRGTMNEILTDIS